MRKTIKCVAPDCPNRTDEKYLKEISFHGFPLDPIRKAEWVAAINRKNWKPSTQSILCSEHFQPEDFDETSQYVRLNNNATPSVFPRKQKVARESKASSREKRQFTKPNHSHKPTVIRKYESSSEDSLKLEVCPDELSEAQLNFRRKMENEVEELNKEIERLSNLPNVEIIFEGEVTSSDMFSDNLSNDRKRKRSVSGTSHEPDLSMELGITNTKLPSSLKPNLRKKKTTRRGRKPAIPRDPKPKDTPVNESLAVGGLTAILPPVIPNGNRVVSPFRRIESNEKLNVSLLVVAKPHLRVKEFTEYDRMQFDIRFKIILSYVPKEFTEWLFKYGLLRSYQHCIYHPSVELNLYNNFTRFPYAGGFAWISDCCPDKIVSVYKGSIFESSPYMPNEVLKLIYHWSYQTNFKDMVKLVKVDQAYTTLVYLWLRAICTVTVQTHVGLFGGPGKKVEVGMITLMGMHLPNSDNGGMVEVLGLLEVETQKIRLRALESISKGNSDRRKHVGNILELLSQWIHPQSVVAIDATIDKSDFIKRGFANVQQATSGDHSPLNTTIMLYLRLVLPRMFENSISLLTINVIQQFLDELVWREQYGTTPAEAFDNINLHISQQTHIDTNITNRLAQISANPFRNWQSKG